MLVGMVPTMSVDVEDGVIVIPEVVWDMMADLDTKERWEKGELVGRRTIEKSLHVAERTAFFGSPREATRTARMRPMPRRGSVFPTYRTA